MNRKVALVVMLMASLTMLGSEMGIEADHSLASLKQMQKPSLGPVCFPGDPCGPWPGGTRAVVASFIGPVCYPGDPCGPRPGGTRAVVRRFIGPVCYPGDPCGPHSVRLPISGIGFSGSVCFPGDPCGPRPRAVLNVDTP